MAPPMIVGLVWASLLMVASAAQAQEIAHSFKELRLIVNPGDEVTVSTRTGEEFQGTVGRISESSCVLVPVRGNERPRTLQEDDVSRVTSRRVIPDSNREGMWAGLIVGGAMGVAGAVSRNPKSGDRGSPLGVLVWSGIGTLIGIGIDAAQKKEHDVVVFERLVSPAVRLQVPSR